MQRSEFNYQLPPSLIAQHPPEERGSSRLLEVGTGRLDHHAFAAIVDLLDPGDLLVVNDTRVIKARLRGAKDTGGSAEILVERIESPAVALCQVRVSKPLQAGRTIAVGSAKLSVISREGEFYRLEFPETVAVVLEREGRLPLPPYITRDAGDADAERYQTVYGRAPGAVAAPTAGLHFTAALLEAIRARGVAIAPVTLHVGAGTFQPIRVAALESHRMHTERYTVPEATAEAIRATHARGGRIVAVGTTVVRALESAACADHRVAAGPGETDLFITPGFRFRVVDVLVTNFHLPESSLLVLVCAFAGHGRIMRAYETAIAEGYRFFSYGDAMWVERGPVAGGAGS